MNNKSKIASISRELRPVGRRKAPVLIFRPLRPWTYIQRMARLVVEAKSAEFGESLLRRDMEVIAQGLVEAGADPGLVKKEVCSLEAAIRAQIWMLILRPEDAR